VRRRAFLAVVAGVTAVGAGAAVAARLIGWRRLTRNLGRLERVEGFGRMPGDRLRNHYSWLAVDPAAFDSYVRDYQRFYGPLDRFSIPRPDFYTAFLLSTDFFTSHGAHQTKGSPVTYAVFYEPAASPCYNPLAQPPPSDEELQRSARG
jgi:hypothetical protein